MLRSRVARYAPGVAMRAPRGAMRTSRGAMRTPRVALRHPPCRTATPPVSHCDIPRVALRHPRVALRHPLCRTATRPRRTATLTVSNALQEGRDGSGAVAVSDEIVLSIGAWGVGSRGSEQKHSGPVFLLPHPTPNSPRPKPQRMVDSCQSAFTIPAVSRPV